MPCILSNLAEIREQNNIAIETLADTAKISIDLLSNIEMRKTLADAFTWRGILSALDFVNISFASDGFIDELNEEIELFGADAPCVVFYDIEKDNIIFKDYAMPGDPAPADMYPVEMTLQLALDFFILQNEFM